MCIGDWDGPLSDEQEKECEGFELDCTYYF
jgi:hypothetical protein